MRGADVFQESLFTTVQLESFVPSDHPLRAVKALLDEAMVNMNWLFESIYCDTGRESIPPERLIRKNLEGQVLQLPHCTACRALCDREY